ncbi:hypothetical protein BB560_006512 [Smittium megazygosporum]|uniref:Uncharacterized protein n=1 Tax=Smittium megazygosporum TaxID=133381 RepID=A0A2T9Y4V7_9FUNG|nr:hypothetical protein BB560_006512 [Smittium megazygosporum]
MAPVANILGATNPVTSLLGNKNQHKEHEPRKSKSISKQRKDHGPSTGVILRENASNDISTSTWPSYDKTPFGNSEFCYTKNEQREFCGSNLQARNRKPSLVERQPTPLDLWFIPSRNLRNIFDKSEIFNRNQILLTDAADSRNKRNGVLEQQ